MIRVPFTPSSGQVIGLRERGCGCDLELLPDQADFDCPVHGFLALLPAIPDERRR